MTKIQALRLRVGDRIAFGDSMWTAKVDARGGAGRWRWATVVRVTPKGGILATVDGGGDEWVPYHRVHQGMTE